MPSIGSLEELEEVDVDSCCFLPLRIASAGPEIGSNAPLASCSIELAELRPPPVFLLDDVFGAASLAYSPRLLGSEDSDDDMSSYTSSYPSSESLSLGLRAPLPRGGGLPSMIIPQAQLSPSLESDAETVLAEFEC